MNFYEKFKSDCPQLSFKTTDEVSVKLNVVDPYELMDQGEELTNESIEKLNVYLSELKEAGKMAPELLYLVPIFEKFIKAIEENKTLKVEFTFDLVKLKYCKTLLAYIGEEYSEQFLAILDDMQDYMVDYYGIDSDRVFFFPTSQSFCVLRKDLQEEELGAPVAGGYWHSNIPLQYKWENEDKPNETFMVLLKGFWQEANSIDFEFPFEHLRVE